MSLQSFLLYVCLWLFRLIIIDWVYSLDRDEGRSVGGRRWEVRGKGGEGRGKGGEGRGKGGERVSGISHSSSEWQSPFSSLVHRKRRDTHRKERRRRRRRGVSEWLRESSPFYSILSTQIDPLVREGKGGTVTALLSLILIQSFIPYIDNERGRVLYEFIRMV